MRWRIRREPERPAPPLVLVSGTRDVPGPMPVPSSGASTNRFGRNLRRERLARGWSERELGDAVGLPESLIIGVEQGRAFLPSYLVERLAQCLSMAPQELVSGHPEPGRRG